MLEEALADPNLARRIFPPIPGTAFLIQGGSPGTQDYIAKFDNNGTATLDSVMKEVSGKVGIGMTGPGMALSVYRPAGSQDGIRIEVGGNDSANQARLSFLTNSQEWLNYLDNAGALHWYKGSDYLTILSGGNVGIGTTSPGDLLTVASDQSNNWGTAIGLVDKDNSKRWLLLNRGALDSGNRNKFMLAYYNGTSWISPPLTVQENGNVGIGTPTPNAKLEVKLQSPATGKNELLRLTNDYNSSGINEPTLRLDNGVGTQYWTVGGQVAGGKYFRIMDNELERLRIDSNGNVGIGKTNPAELLDVNGNILSKGLNKIIFLKPNGSTDGTQINDAIDALPSNGGIIYLTSGEYHINTTININKSGVKLRGYGGDAEEYSADASGTVATTSGSSTVTGTGTAFTTEVYVDDYVTIDTAPSPPPQLERKKVTAITDGTHITVDSAFARTASGRKMNIIAAANLSPAPLTRLLWTGSAGSVMVSVAAAHSNVIIQDVELCDLMLDGAGVEGDPDVGVGVGLLLDRVVDSRFRRVRVENIRDADDGEDGIGIKLTSTALIDLPGTAWNLFEDVTVFKATQCLVLTGKEPDVKSNAAHNTFIDLDLEYYGRSDPNTENGTGILLKDCDNNSFYRTWIYRRKTKGSGVVIDDPHNARSNYFYHLQTSDGGLLVKNVPATGAKRNFVFGYDQENGQPDPTAEDDSNPPKPVSADSVLSWTNSLGELRGFAPVVPPQVTSVSETDDFLTSFTSSNPANGTIGKLGWSTNVFTVQQIDGEAGRPGIFQLNTGGGSPNHVVLHWDSIGGTNPFGGFTTADSFDLAFSVRVNTNDTHTQVRVGIADSPLQDPPDYGIYFEKLEEDTTWFLVTNDGTETRIDSGEDVSDLWIRIRIRRIDSSTIGFSWDGKGEIKRTTNIPTGSLQAFVSIKNTEASYKTIDIDYFTFSITGLIR